MWFFFQSGKNDFKRMIRIFFQIVMIHLSARVIYFLSIWCPGTERRNEEKDDKETGRERRLKVNESGN